MANEEHLAILRQGVGVWNAWREAKPNIEPDLRMADLRESNLVDADFNETRLDGANLTKAQLIGAVLIYANLSDAKLTEANLTGANLVSGNFTEADLTNADLSGADCASAQLCGAQLTTANLANADFTLADLTEATLVDTNLSRTNFSDAYLDGAKFTDAFIHGTIFSNNDLSTVVGLNRTRHYGPSSIDIDTLVHSGGKIPESFLRRCGVPDSIIEYLPSLIGAMQPIQFYSCFISHSSKDHDFAQRLYERMESNHLRVWFAPDDMKGGQKLHEQIDQAIRVHDKLVLVLSEESIHSPWVETEIRKARRAELRDNRRKLFPIRLVDFDTLRDWECFDADTGKDLAVELREYFIPDFTRWKDHDAFERAFARFLKDLQATETPPIPAPPKVSTQSKTVPQNPQTVIARKKRRLEKLEEQAAIMGISTPPEVLTEIEDLRREIGELGG